MAPSLGQPELSGLLLRLYGLSHEQPIAGFQDATLALLREALPFDSSMWGTATNTEHGIDIHTIHLHRQPAEMLEAYERLKHLDTAAQAVGQGPCLTMAFNARHWFGNRSQAPLRDHGRRFEQANFLISSRTDAATRFVHWITLFRADDAAHCSAGETALLALLAPHLQQALMLNRIAHLDRLEGAGPGSAICDTRGVIYHADEGFRRLVQAEWSGWRGARLPEPLLQDFRRGQALHRGACTVLTQRQEQGLLFVRARQRERVDDLSERERQVADLVARGQTYKEIAQSLQRSPATVRNQIRAAYAKLQVGNVAGLIEALRASG